MQMSQADPSDLAMQTMLALLPDFLAQRQKEIHKSREAHVRVKSLGTAQQTMSCRVTALEALQRDVSVRQAASAADLATLGRRQNALESGHSAIFLVCWRRASQRIGLSAN
jgi:hypothetical protein